MSPGFSPARNAGVSENTSLKITPLVRGRFNPSASNGVIVCARTPISPRRTRPYFRICCNDVANDVARRGEAEALVAARLRQDQGVDADDVSVHVDQRASAVARIDGRVGLDVDHRIVGLELSRDGADDAEAHRAVQPHRAAEGEHQLTRTDLLRVGEVERRQPLLRHLDDGEIGLVVHGHHLRGHEVGSRLQHRVVRRVVGAWRRRNLHLDPSRALDHVRVGDDVAVGVDDDAGTAATGRRDQHAALVVGQVGVGVTERDDLDDRRADARGEVLQQAAGLPEIAALRREFGPAALRRGAGHTRRKAGQEGERR